MDIRQFSNKSTKDAEIDRLNEEPAVVCSYCGRDEEECEKNKEGEKNPITDWCGGWRLSCDDCYYKNHPESVDEEEEEKWAMEEGGAEALEILLQERRNLFGAPVALVYDGILVEAHPADNTPHTYCGDCDCCVGCDCCECEEIQRSHIRGLEVVADGKGGLYFEAAPIPELLTSRRFDIVCAEIVPDSPKKVTRPRFAVRGVNTREIYWKIPAEIDLEDTETYEMGDKWGTLYITNKKTGQEWEIEGFDGDNDFKRCDETHIESYEEFAWLWSDEEEAE